MAESGLGWTTLSIELAGGAAKDIRSNITNFQFATPRGVQDVTGIDKLAHERLLLLADFSVTMNGVFDDTADKSHDVFKTIPSSPLSRAMTNVISGQSLPVEVLLTDYNLTRAATGELTWQVPGVLADGNVPTWTTA